MEIGACIKRIRKSLELNQSDFATKLDITQTHLSQVESGKNSPSVKLLEKISFETGIPLAIMMFYSLTEYSVPENKREAFKIIKPAADQLIASVFPLN